jgi:hypothetical protein
MSNVQGYSVRSEITVLLEEASRVDWARWFLQPAAAALLTQSVRQESERMGAGAFI